MDSIIDSKLSVQYVPLASLRHAEYNPRVIDENTKAPVRASVEKHGIREPLIVNRAKGRENIIVGGNLRAAVYRDKNILEVPVLWVDIPDIEREKDLCLRLNKAVGMWSDEALAEIGKELGEEFLVDIGFSSEELDAIFPADEKPEMFDLKEELEKLDIKTVDIKRGDKFVFPDGSAVLCGDSTIAEDMLKLMDGDKADMVMTDPPYRLQYLNKGKRRDGATTGFGMKKNRRYLETESLPADFTTLWMEHVSKVAAPDFSIIVYENWKNLREIWGEIEKHFKVCNMIVWHLPNRNQGYAGRNKFFSKHDIAMVGTSETHGGLNLDPEDELLENEYQTALFAIQGKGAHWEGYEKGRRYCPTDHIEFNAADAKSSGQGIIFGVKPIEILIPYIKVLTRRGQLVLEPFGGSGSSAVAAFKLGRKFRLMEKSPVYTAVILKRLESIIGLAPQKV